ncbi:hypothetical protein IFR05_015031 [Cadophora sp. M221]|nr:hypothetical protein IFR05_015031 [Cadophora sp. M221]
MATPTPVQQLQQLTEQVANLQIQVEALQTAARTSARPKPILPDPAKFNAIKAKLRVNGLSSALGDSVAQFYYVYDRLESQVQSQVLPQLATAKQKQFWLYQLILD